MTTIACHIPLKLRFLGEPGDEEWDALEEVLTAQYSLALRRGVEWMLSSGHLEPGPVREVFDPGRLRPEGYLIPSYDSGRDKVAPVDPGSAIDASDPAQPDDTLISISIIDLSPSSDGRPKDGVSYGVYVTRMGDTQPRLYLKDAEGKFVVLDLTYTDGDKDVPIGLPAGDYDIVARPNLKGRVTRGNRLVTQINNRTNLEVSVHFRVPLGPKEKAASKPTYRFYPYVDIRSLNNEEMTTGAEAIYLAEVVVYLLGEDGNTSPMFWLWLGYGSLEYAWEVWKIDPVLDGPLGAESLKKVYEVPYDRHRAYLHYTWKEPGNFEIRVKVRLIYEGASPEPAYNERRDAVIELESKQALELALMVIGEENKATGERVWARSVDDLFARYKLLLDAETNAGRRQAIREVMAKLAKLLFGTTTQGPFPIPAIFSERRTGESRPLSLFVGPFDPIERKKPQNWKLIDLTFPAFYETYQGSGDTAQGAIEMAFHEAIDRFHNHYPPGQIRARLEFPGMDRFGLTPVDKTIPTESWKREAWEWFSAGAQAVGTFALAASFIFPPSAVVTGLVIVSVAAGAAVSASNIADRINTNSFEWDGQAVSDLVNIAASLTLIGGAVTRGLAAGTVRAITEGESITIQQLSRLATLKKIQNGLLLMGLGGDLSNGVLITAEAYKEISEVEAGLDPNVLRDYIKLYGKEEGERRWQVEKQTRIIGILARAAAAGFMTAIAIRSTAHAIAEGTARLGAGNTGGGTTAGGPPAPPVDPTLGATSPVDYLARLRADAQTHPAGSAGRGWDHSRFPSEPPGTQWRPGDPIDMPYRGDYVSYDTARGRYWKNRAYFESAARARGEVAVDPASPDPIRRLSDQDLQGTIASGTAPPAISGRPGQVTELEHSGVPQRVNDWLIELGFPRPEARSVAKVSDPKALFELNPLEHAFFDAVANRFPTRRDVTGRGFAGSTAADVRLRRPLAPMDDATIQQIVLNAGTRGYNFNRTPGTRQLRDALRTEINLRNLPIAPP